jgi:hypothetical protein
MALRTWSAESHPPEEERREMIRRFDQGIRTIHDYLPIKNGPGAATPDQAPLAYWWQP